MTLIVSVVIKVKCGEILHRTYQTNINAINLIQKRAMRMINKAYYREHANQFFIHKKL